MSVATATAAAAEEADSVPQCIKISKDLLDALVKSLLKSASPGTHAAHLQTRVEQRLAKILPSVKTPDHPPYALMIRQAITELDEEGGSNEEAISEFIKLKYKDLPWGHVNFLTHHLKKLMDEEEIFQVSGNRYKLLPEDDDSIGKVKRNIKRKRRSGKEECYSQCKVSKSGGSSKENNSADMEEALHHMKDDDGIEQQKQEVTCSPRKETILMVEVNEEVSQVHIVEDSSREPCVQEVPCVPSQIGSEIGEEADVTQKEYEGMEEGQVLLQRQEKEFRENQSREVTCTARKQTALGFEVNSEANQMEVEPIQVEEDLDQMEDNSLAIEGEKEETTRNNEDAPIEKQEAAGVSEEKFDAKVAAIEMQEQPMEMQGLSGVLEGKNVSKGAENLMEEQCDGLLQVAVIEKGQVKAVGLEKQEQPWELEVNEQHLQLKEIGAEILECIENIITPQIPPKVAVGNNREGEACGRTANLISSPALSSLRQKEQCLELLSRTAKIQGLVVELMKSFAMLESNESELPDEQLPNATAETALPSCRDVVVFEPQENVEISCSTRLEDKEAEVAVFEPQENVEISCSTRLEDKEAEVAVVVEPEEQVEKLSDSSTNTTTTNPLQVEPPQEPEVGSTIVEEEATDTSLLLNLNSTLNVSGFLPEKEALNNNEPSAENYVKNSFQPKTISSILEGKDIPGHTVSANPTLLSLSLASQEQQQQKPTDFVDGNQQLYQQKEELPTPVLKQNAEPSFWQQHVQSESQSVNLQKEEIPTQVLKQNAEPSFWRQHVQSESQSVNLQEEEIPTPVLKQNAEPSFWRQHVQSESQSVNLQKEELPTSVLKQNAKPSFWQQHVQSESQSVNLQKEELPTPVLQQNAEPSFWQHHVQSESQSVNLQKEKLPTTGIFCTPQKQQQKPMLLLHGQQKQMLSPQLPSSFDVGSLFGNSLFQQPLTISPMKPSSLSGEKLRPLKPIELKKLMKDSVKPTPKPSPAKPIGTPQQVIDVDEIEAREVESSSVGGFKRKLQFQASPDKSPSLMSSDKKVGEVVGESEQVTPKKRRGRPPKQQTPGHTPSPQNCRPKIKKTVPKKKTNAAADEEEGPSSKSLAKQGL